MSTTETAPNGAHDNVQNPEVSAPTPSPTRFTEPSLSEAPPKFTEAPRKSSVAPSRASRASVAPTRASVAQIRTSITQTKTRASLAATVSAQASGNVTSGGRLSIVTPSGSAGTTGATGAANDSGKRLAESKGAALEGTEKRKSVAIVEEIEDADQFFIQHDDEYDEIGHTLKGLDTHHEEEEGVKDEGKSGEEEEVPTGTEKKHKGGEDLQADFFDKGEDTDADKKKVVEKIEGMEAEEDFFGDYGEEPHPEEDTKSQKSSKSTKSAKSQKSVKSGKTSEQSGPADTLSKERRITDDTEGESRISIKRAVSGSVTTSAAAVSFIQDETSKGGEFAAGERKKGKKKDKKSEKAEDMPVYETAPRYEGSDEALLGFDISQETEPVKLFDDVEEVVEEEELSSKEEEVPVLERGPYYERHAVLSGEILRKQSYNFILQKKLAMFFKRRKMDYVTRETEWSFDAQQKYHRKLEAYGELKDMATAQCNQMTRAIEASRAIKNKKSGELALQFKKMQDREAEIGFGLINTKTGNAIPDKHVERLIRRQQFQMDQVCSMRLKFIKLKDMVQEKLDAISALDKIGPNLLLADYEQLKIDNMSHADKIEEKEEELTRLRSKCANTIQVLAHIREKSAALEADLDDLKQERIEVEADYIRIRENMNYLKTQRITYRQMTNKIVEESGLLTQPTLLNDMERALHARQTDSALLENLLADYKKRARHIKTIRKKIEEQTELKKALRRTGGLTKKYSAYFGSKSHQKLPKIYKGRPTLLMPTIEPQVFESLKAIKPKMTITKKRNTPNINRTKCN